MKISDFIKKDKDIITLKHKQQIENGLLSAGVRQDKISDIMYDLAHRLLVENPIPQNAKYRGLIFVGNGQDGKRHLQIFFDVELPKQFWFHGMDISNNEQIFE